MTITHKQNKETQKQYKETHQQYTETHQQYREQDNKQIITKLKGKRV